jgi:hypothetical protein
MLSAFVATVTPLGVRHATQATIPVMLILVGAGTDLSEAFSVVLDRCGSGHWRGNSWTSSAMKSSK